MSDHRQVSGASTDHGLTDQARTTITDLVALIEELNGYTEQLRALVSQVEGENHD